MRIIKRISSIALTISISITVLSTQVFAWKPQTHNYLANLILEEIEKSGGKVEISPFGSFNVAPEFLDAIRTYPDAYRAGSIGPDGYPDIYVGQSFIHPYDSKNGMTSGEWLKSLCNDALSLSQNSPKRKEVVAYLLGFMTHYSGDMFGHNYINEIAGGPFPSENYSDPKNITNILRHVSAESKIDSKIPSKYKQGKYINLNAPKDFVLNSFVR